MTITATIPRSFIDHITGASDPDWMKDLRHRALELADYPRLPSPRLESWRKIDLNTLDLASYHPTEAGTELEIECANPDVKIGEGPQPIGEEHSELWRKTTQHRIDLSNNNVFNLLGTALPIRQASVSTERTVVEPVLIRHTLTRGDALFHRVLISVAPGADLTVVEDLRGGGEEEFHLWNNLTDAVVGANGRLNYIVMRRFGRSDFHFHNFQALLERDAKVHLTVIHVGGFKGKSFYTARLCEPGGEFRGIGLAAGTGREFTDTEMRVEHFADHTESSLLYKTVQADRAHSVFNGNLHIPRGVRKARSHQINNNIILGSKARAESMPNLIIQAEDVSAEHGATVGELDQEAIFFLMARGLPEQEARRLLIEGFLNEVVGELPLESLQEEVLELIKSKISL